MKPEYASNEEQFAQWWEANRDRQKKWLNQLTVGLPLGLVFGLPVLLSVMFRGWYKRMPYVSGTQLTLIIMACMAIAVFFAIFRMRFKWEMNEQRYREWLAQKKKANHHE